MDFSTVFADLQLVYKYLSVPGSVSNLQVLDAALDLLKWGVDNFVPSPITQLQALSHEDSVVKLKELVESKDLIQAKSFDWSTVPSWLLPLLLTVVQQLLPLILHA